MYQKRKSPYPLIPVTNSLTGVKGIYKNFSKGGEVDESKKKKKASILVEYKPLGDDKRDEAFVKEAENIKAFYSKRFPDTEVDILPFYGQEEFDNIKNRISGDVFMLGHSGGQFGGLEHPIIADTLNKSNIGDCYMGICSTKNFIDVYKKSLPNELYSREEGSWYGFNGSSYVPKSEENPEENPDPKKELIDRFFGRSWTGNPKDFYGAGIVQPVEGEHYVRSRRRVDQIPITSLERPNPDQMRQVNNVVSYNIPKYGLGAFLKSSVDGDSLLGISSTLAAAGQSGRPSGFKGFLSGAGAGAGLGTKLGTIVPGIGNVIGAIGGGLIGGIAGLISGRKRRKQLDETLEDQQDLLAERRFEENEARLELQRSKGVLAQYPVDGLEEADYFGKTFGYGGNMYGKRKLKNYSNGGMAKPEYLAEGGEAIEYSGQAPSVHGGTGQLDPVSTTMAGIEGPSHESSTGGVPMSGGERIYSDRLYPTEELKALLKSLKITPSGTYADIAKRIGKKEGKQEVAVVSDDRFERTRGEKMMERLNLAKELVFADQEASKPEEILDMTSVQEEFSYGGNLPKYGFGASPMWATAGIDAYNKLKEREALGMMDTGAGMGAGTKKSKFLEGFGDFTKNTGKFLNDNLDMIATGANYAMNERMIDKMPLTQKTRMFEPVLLDETRRDQYAQNQVGQFARQGMRAMQASGTQSRNALIGDIVSRAVEGSNKISDQENQRIDRIRQLNSQMSNQAGQYNTQLANEIYGDYQTNRMLQLSERMKNRNNLTASILGNLQIRKMNEMDRMKMALVAEMDKERGIIGRSDTYSKILDSIFKKGWQG